MARAAACSWSARGGAVAGARDRRHLHGPSCWDPDRRAAPRPHRTSTIRPSHPEPFKPLDQRSLQSVRSSSCPPRTVPPVRSPGGKAPRMPCPRRRRYWRSRRPLSTRVSSRCWGAARRGAGVPLPRRLPPWPDPLHGARLRDHRFRGASLAGRSASSSTWLPLTDVAGMLRSFDYAASGALLQSKRSGTHPPRERGKPGGLGTPLVHLGLGCVPARLQLFCAIPSRRRQAVP